MLQSTLTSAHIFAFTLHKLSAIALMLGLLFFVVWAIKNIHKDKLKKLSVTLIVIGVLGAILSGMIGGGSYRYHKKGFYDKGDYIKKFNIEQTTLPSS